MLRYDILNYTDADGLVAPNKCASTDRGVSGNGVLYTAELVAILASRGELLDSDKDRWRAAMKGCMVVPGLVERGPTKIGDQEGPDDYVGYAVGAFLCDPDAAGAVIQRAWDWNGFLNNEVHGSTRHPDGSINWSAFLIRQPALVALYYYAAGKKPIVPLRMFSALSLALSGFSDPGNVMLSWMRMQVVGEQDWMHRLASWIWKKRLRSSYPNGMQDVAAKYFQAGHPFVQYWQD